MSTAVVLGGGISGLSTAYYLKQHASKNLTKIILIEKTKQFGGWVNSHRSNDSIVHELGPRSIRFQATGKVGANTLKLVEDLNLADDVLKVSIKETKAQKRYLVHRGKLMETPQSKFFASPPLKKSIFRYVLKDLFRSKRKKIADESLYEFFTRRYGSDIGDSVIDPLCRGIVAGNAKEISVRALFPLYYKAEQDHGSLILGMLSHSRKCIKEIKSLNSGLCNQAALERWSMWNLRKGLKQLPDALLNNLKEDKRVQIIHSRSCDRIQFADKSAKVHVGDECFEAKHVISCLPSFELSKVMSLNYPHVSAILDRIKFVHVAVINFEFSGIALPVQAFGYLIPSSDSSKVLGVVFDSCNFKAHDGSDGAERTRLTCMLGGHWFDEHFGDVRAVDESVLLEAALTELKTRLNITQKPSKYYISIQKNCIPQYQVGHLELVELLRMMLKEMRIPLTITGSSFDGVSVNDVIYNSRTNVEDIIRKRKL